MTYPSCDELDHGENNARRLSREVHLEEFSGVFRLVERIDIQDGGSPDHQPLQPTYKKRAL